VPIDTKTPESDGWWLQRCYDQLRTQQDQCEDRDRRFRGEPELSERTPNEREVMRLFEKLGRRNFERIIVNAILSRLGVVGIRTAVDDDEGGDAEAFRIWKKLRGKLWTADAFRMKLSMGLAYVIVGRDEDGQPLVTAEDPRFVTAITDPANPYNVLAALKLFHDDVADQDVAYLYLPGRVMVATRPRKAVAGAGIKFNARYWEWSVDVEDVESGQLIAGLSPGSIDALNVLDENGEVIGQRVPVVEFANDGRDAQFAPFLDHIDGIRKQVLDRMTIATIQAFKQRAFKGLPKVDEQGNEINYEGMFESAPGAVWDLPEATEIWESGQVDMTGILAAIRDDVKDLYALSGTPGYLASPDAANASAESASLQREMNIFNVRSSQNRDEPALERVAELIFLYLSDAKRAQVDKLEVIWAPVELLSIAEKGSAVAQTKGVVPRYLQLTDIMGYTPAQADRAMTLLTDDLVLDQQFAIAQQAVTTGPSSGSA
jgi:hypothetical protein